MFIVIISNNMLALKKMASKKLVIYAAIIVFMLAGTGYLLYLNNRLAAKKPLVVDSADQPAQVQGLPAGHGLDLTIFSDEKFKALTDDALIPKTAPSLGKQDPFKPN